jgi:hypothetical protein
MLRDGTAYQDLGPGHFGRRTASDRAARLVQHLTSLDYTILPPAQPAPV